MSLGLLDADNPWNDPLISTNSTPETGHASATAAAAADGDEDAFSGRSASASGDAPNGYVSGAKPVVNDAAPFELVTSNGLLPGPASSAPNGWSPAPSPSAPNGAASRWPSATASPSMIHLFAVASVTPLDVGRVV